MRQDKTSSDWTRLTQTELRRPDQTRLDQDQDIDEVRYIDKQIGRQTDRYMDGQIDRCAIP